VPCCGQSFSAGCRVLNLFGYTGGFSVYAGLAGAAAVTTVDVADAALAAADANWALNGLKASTHEAVTMDAFEFLERAHAGAACGSWCV
jgi:23S rRNA (cytosine1962-C5)-methyltransferase